MSSCLTEAARLVAGQHGAAQRLRTGHRPRPDGTCGGCGHVTRIRWPCVLITIADLADAVRPDGGDDVADPAEPDPEPGRPTG